MGSDLADFIGFALLIVAVGASLMLCEIGEARATNAKARLLEAENRRAALNHHKGEGSDAT